MQVIILGGAGLSKEIRNIALRMASIAKCEVVVDAMPEYGDILCVPVQGEPLTAEKVHRLVNECKPDTDDYYSIAPIKTFTPHYAKQNKRGKFKRKGR